MIFHKCWLSRERCITEYMNDATVTMFLRNVTPEEIFTVYPNLKIRHLVDMIISVCQ